MWKRTVLELGGYNPMIVLDDTELQYSVDSAIFGAFFHQGQICLNTRKIIVQRRLYGEFLEKFVQRARALPGGDPGVGSDLSVRPAARAARGP